MSDRSMLLEKLRLIMKKEAIDAWLFPMADPFHNETVAEHFNYIKFFTGFTGSAGCLFITQDQAIFITDGRYTIQAKTEIDSTLFQVKEGGLPALGTFLKEERALRIAFNPWMFTFSQLNYLKKLGHAWIPMEGKEIDNLWEDRPSLPWSSLKLHEEKFAGESSSIKRKRCGAAIASKGMQAFLLTSGDSLCWLLNVRGGDVRYTPIPFAYGLLHASGAVDVFIDPSKVSLELKTVLGPEVRIHSLQAISSVLAPLRQIGIDEKQTPAALYTLCDPSSWITGEDPCLLPKACKNEVEQRGAREAHQMDGLAVTRFLYWVQQQEGVTEWDAAQKLDALRQEGMHYQGPSFDTISATGSHGALCHYRPAPYPRNPLAKGHLYLVDSGGQYLTGTTDVTRTIILGGMATPQQKTHYTRVLKGHIAFASIRFPKGTSALQLDVLARQYLWEQGLDYAHATGHGVGSYLCVHESPPIISPRAAMTPLLPGMIVAHEPGFYLENHYGIRLENIILVRECENFSGFLEFETLTMVPFDLNLIDFDLLTSAEKTWLQQYHQRVWEACKEALSEEERQWLKRVVGEFVSNPGYEVTC